MFDVFTEILCVLRNVVTGFVWAVLEAVNFIVLGVGTVLETVLGLLPTMPDVPADSAPAEAVGWLNWLLPIAGLLTAAAAFVACYLAYLLIKTIGRWVKAL